MKIVKTGKVIAVCTSEKKGTLKIPVPQAEFKVDFGIDGDAHAGNWHRQISLLFRGDAVALNSFLNGFVVRPEGQAVLFEIRDRAFPLLGKGSSKKPCRHHVYILLFHVKRHFFH